MFVFNHELILIIDLLVKRHDFFSVYIEDKQSFIILMEA